MLLNRAYLSLGSNINPKENIKAALAKLSGNSRLVAISAFWETEPVGFVDQPDFLNGAAIIETHLSAKELKHQLLASIENELGRVRTENKNAPRPIDLDIILFNDDLIEADGVQVPNPELFKYAFVAIPLAEIAPDYIHPLTGQPLAEIAQQFAAQKAQMIRVDINT